MSALLYSCPKLAEIYVHEERGPYRCSLRLDWLSESLKKRRDAGALIPKITVVLNTKKIEDVRVAAQAWEDWHAEVTQAVPVELILVRHEDDLRQGPLRMDVPDICKQASPHQYFPCEYKFTFDSPY